MYTKVFALKVSMMSISTFTSTTPKCWTSTTLVKETNVWAQRNFVTCCSVSKLVEGGLKVVIM